MIKNISFSPCENSSFVKTKRMHYTQKNISKAWDMVEVHDSVSILIYHKDKNAFVLVKQLRTSPKVRFGLSVRQSMMAIQLPGPKPS